MTTYYRPPKKTCMRTLTRPRFLSPDSIDKCDMGGRSPSCTPCHWQEYCAVVSSRFQVRYRQTGKYIVKEYPLLAPGSTTLYFTIIAYLLVDSTLTRGYDSSHYHSPRPEKKKSTHNIYYPETGNVASRLSRKCQRQGSSMLYCITPATARATFGTTVLVADRKKRSTKKKNKYGRP